MLGMWREIRWCSCWWRERCEEIWTERVAWCNKGMCAQSCPTLCGRMDCSCQAPLSVESSRQEYWSGLVFPSPGNLPNPGIKPTSLVSPALASGFFTTSTTWEAPCIVSKLSSCKIVIKIGSRPRIPIWCQEEKTCIQRDASLVQVNQDSHRLKLHWKWAHKPQTYVETTNFPKSRVSRHTNQQELDITEESDRDTNNV